MRRITRSRASEAAASEPAEQTQPPPSGVVVAESSAEMLGGRRRAAVNAQRSERGRNQPSPCREVEVAREGNTIWDHDKATIATTASAQIVCPACMRDLNTRLLCLSAKELESHFKDKHRGVKITWKRNVCDNGKTYGTANGLRLHAIHCKGEAAPAPELPYKCDECGSSFHTQMGLTQHIRLRHPQTCNARRAEQAQAKAAAPIRKGGQKPSLLNDEEFAELIRLNRQYRGTIHINTKIREHFPQLTSKQISDLRRRIPSSPSRDEATSSESEGEASANETGNRNSPIQAEEDSSSGDENFVDASDLDLAAIANADDGESERIGGEPTEPPRESEPEEDVEAGTAAETVYSRVGPLREMSDPDEEEAEVGTATEAGAQSDPPSEDSHCSALRARINEPVEVDVKWSPILDSIVSAANSTECTRERLDGIYESIVKILAVSDKSGAGREARNNDRTVRRRTNRNQAPTRAQKKRHFYARCQDLYNENPKKLAELVVENDFSLLEKSNPPGVEQVRRLYEELWSQKGPDLVIFEGVDTPPLGADEILTPVSREEVKHKIAKLASDVAAGIDGIRKGCLRSKDTDTVLANFFNLIMLKSHYPTEWKKNRTTLIPKVGRDRSDVRNWRPITIGSLVGRLYSGLLDRRLRSVTKQCPRQKGFSDENGCYINVTTFNRCVRLAKESGGIFGITDMEKAFDTVPHAAIHKALERKGIPASVASYIGKMYENCTTIIRADGGEVQITLERGVKQGDPLSPLIFNLCIEPLIEKIQCTTRGITLTADQHVAAIAFADDLLLLASDRETAETQFQVTHSYLKELGMKLSVEKCSVVQYVPLRKSYYTKDPEITVDGARLKAVGPDEAMKYLGAKIKPWEGLVDSFELTAIEQLFQRVKRLALKPMQKLELLRVYLIPRFIYGLIVKPPSVVTLREVDTLIRREVREMLRMHPTVCNELLYTTKRSGGLGLPEIEKLVLIAALRNGLKALDSEDPVTRTVMNSESTSKELERYAKLLRINWPTTLDIVDKFKEKYKKSYINRWSDHIAQGEGVLNFANDPVANEWLKRSGILKPSLIAKAISLRTNTAGVRSAIRRDPIKRATIPSVCRKCGHDPENLPHVLGQCVNTKMSRIRRHDEIKNFVAEKAADRFTVLDEPRLHHQGKLHKPDLVLVNEAGALIVDVTVRYEKGEYLEDGRKEKLDKYDSLRTLIAEMFKKERTNVEVAPIVVGTRGALPAGTRAQLSKLGIKRKGDWLTISMIALRHAILIVDKFIDYEGNI